MRRKKTSIALSAATVPLFVRSAANTVDAEKVGSRYDKGILKIALAKRAEAKPRQIKVTNGQNTLQDKGGDGLKSIFRD